VNVSSSQSIPTRLLIKGVLYYTLVSTKYDANCDMMNNGNEGKGT